MGGPTAYKSSVLSGFPNFFIFLGPNAATGHTSALMAAENSINFALRVIKPVLDGQASVVDLKPQAEAQYTERLQRDLKGTVWNSRCQSWYISDGGGSTWNAMSHPWTQSYFWFRSRFPTWSDWRFRDDVDPGRAEWLPIVAALVALGAAMWWSWNQNLSYESVMNELEAFL